MDRDYVLKSYFNKVSEAKKQNIRELRMSVKELDDIGYILYELLSEYYNKTIEYQKEDGQLQKRKIKNGYSSFCNSECTVTITKFENQQMDEIRQKLFEIQNLAFDMQIKANNKFSQSCRNQLWSIRQSASEILKRILEIQVLDSYNNPTYVNGQAGSVYKQSVPLANAMRKPGEWNVYDIIYTAPTFKEDGTYRTRPMVTLIQNGVVLQYNTVILGTTEYIGFPRTVKHGAGPILLQSHGDPSEPISYRNIWIRKM